MENTKHDLSAGEVRLDYQALIVTAKIAVGDCIENINHYLNQIRMSNNLTSRYCDANFLKKEANRLAISCETLSALEGGLTREDKIIVNI